MWIQQSPNCHGIPAESPMTLPCPAYGTIRKAKKVKMNLQGLKLRDPRGEYAGARPKSVLLRSPIAEKEKSQARDLLPGSLHRVLYAVVLDPAMKFGSLEEQIVCLAQAFEANGSLFLPLFICREETFDPSLYQKFGIETACLDLRFFSWSRLLKLSKIITNHNISVVHWNFTEMLRNDYLWCLTLLNPSVRHYYTDHISRRLVSSKPSGRLRNELKRLVSSRYDKVLCVSQFILNDLRRQRTCSNLTLCRHFINTERFRPDPWVRCDLRRKFDVEGRFVVLTVAHLIKEKGIDVLIRAMAELPDNVVLWIVGDGEDAEVLHQLSSDLHMSSRVYFHGLQRNVAPFMQAADCFVCPSLWAEAAGLVNLEAAACGLPVIASRIGGIPDYVEDRGTGLLFLPGDPLELAKYIRLILEDPSLCREMSLHARARAVAKFTMDVGIREHLQIYRN
jgi:glycosyltransferase involved in cell wall biosynthesis